MCVCVCVCVCVCSSFKTFPEFIDIIYIYPLLQFTGFPTANKEMYINILCHLRDVVRTKRPEKWRTKSWFLPHDNAPEQWLVLVKDLSSTNNVTTQEHLLYSPDLAPADFYLPFLPISALKGWGFCDATDIIKNVMEELKRLSQNVFQECFHYLYSHWQNCIVAQGDYIKGNMAEMIIMVCISQK